MAGWNTADIPTQTGRTVLVTGANSGLGLATATALARAGARVLMGCRDAGRAAEAKAKVAAVATGPDPEVVPLDLADLGSIERAAADVANRTESLDVLHNNAGVMALPHRRTADGFEMQFGTNHLGHFALTGRLLPLLLAADAPRVVTTSSFMHRIGKMRWDDLQYENGYAKWPAYGQSKLANLLFAYELDRRARAAGSPLLSVAAHPGYASTHLQAAGPEMAGAKLMSRMVGVGNAVFAQSAADGALPQLYAATMPEVAGGQYYGPRIGEMRGAPKRVGSTKASRNTDDAARLWRESEALTGVTYDFSVGADEVA